MAATVTVEYDLPVAEGASLHQYIGTIVPGTYATGGVAVDYNKNERFRIIQTGGSGGYLTSWDSTNQKLIIYRQKDPGNAGGADIPLPEVANAVDLSAITFNFVGWGS